MKRKTILGGLVGLVLSVTAIVNFSLSNEKITFSDLVKANIEALANGESGGGGMQMKCNTTGSKTCAKACDNCGCWFTSTVIGEGTGLKGTCECGKTFSDF